MGTWTNADGLHIKMGTTEGESTTRIGENNRVGGIVEHEIDLVLTDVTATQAILNDTHILPNNFFVFSMEVITTVVATGSSATLDVGTMQEDRTDLDANGLLAAYPLASFSVIGETALITEASTYSGAQVGTVIAEASRLSFMTTDANLFTAGECKIILRGYCNALTNNAD